MPKAALFLALALALAALGCNTVSRSEDAKVAPPKLDALGADDVVGLLPKKLENKEGWARDILAALTAHDLGTAPASVCSVLAVIEQESGFKANPVVPNLPKIVRARLDAYATKLGPIGEPALAKLLEGRAPGHKRSFEERLEAVKTERDLDRVFRDLVRYYEEEYPKTFAVAELIGSLFTKTTLDDLNPITTAGSMQVSVRFAKALGERRKLDSGAVREALYTREGGVFYGTARLLGYEAGYDTPLYRFADYNAGLYASRNAALQEQLSKLTGQKLAPDGDLLAYDMAGEPLDKETNTLRALYAFRASYAPELSERQVRKDALKEKTLELESSETWRALKRAYRKATGISPSYARVPNVAIESPKLSRKLSTAWFAKNVNLRFERCMTRWRAQKRGPQA